MFKMSSRANLAHHFSLSVSNQISIEQEGSLALISSAHGSRTRWWPTASRLPSSLMEFNNGKVW
jgi:hypothetical protein